MSYNGSAWINTSVDSHLSIAKLSVDTTLNKTTHRYIRVDTSTGDVTLTLPQIQSSVHMYDIWKTTSDTNDVIVQRSGTDTIIGSTSFQFNTQWEHHEFVSDGSRTWLMK